MNGGRFFQACVPQTIIDWHRLASNPDDMGRNVRGSDTGIGRVDVCQIVITNTYVQHTECTQYKFELPKANRSPLRSHLARCVIVVLHVLGRLISRRASTYISNHFLPFPLHPRLIAIIWNEEILATLGYCSSVCCISLYVSLWSLADSTKQSA